MANPSGHAPGHASDGAASTHKHSSHPAPIRRLVRLLEAERSSIRTIFLFSVVTGVLYLATPLAVDAVVNNIAFGGEEKVYAQALLIVSFALFVFLALLAVVRGAQHYVLELIMRRLFVRMTADMAFRLPRVTMETVDSQLGPSLVNRFFDVVTVQKASSLLLLDGVNVVLTGVIGLVLLAFYHPFLLAFALVLVALLAVVLFGLGRNAVTTSIRKSYAKHAVAGWLEQIALFPHLFKEHGAATLACRRADVLAHEYVNARRAHFRILLRQIGGLLAIQALASGALLSIGGVLVLRGELTLGQLVASELVVSAIVSSVASLGKQLESWYDALAAVDKLGSIVDLPIERENGEAPRTTPDQGAAVALHDVDFSYGPHRPVLEGLTLEIEPGSRVALTGPAGSGTSTLLDLLFGLRTPQHGQVQVDELDVRHWRLDDLRAQVALVRGPELVEGSIIENVQLGRDTVSMHDVREALERVGLLGTLMDLPRGLETPLRAGGRPLSGSQRSRLILARAIVDRPRLLLLDLVLEHLEPDTFADLADFLFDRTQPWTLVIASHDPDVLRRCDTVVDLGHARPTRARLEPVVRKAE